jgi:hypothetical protein
MTSWTSGSVLSSDTMDPYEIDIAQTKTMQIDMPLVVRGRDVMKELDEMRDALLLIKRDVDMEAKYPKLKEIKDEYEAQLAKYKTFDILKDSK